jgi:CheY-like chemotaxis protein
MLEILYVEDNPADVFLISTAIKKIGSDLILTSVGDGEAALEFLKRTNEHPCVILLDLGLPRVDGTEVFKALKSDPRLCNVPTVVFAERDGRRRIENTGHVPNLFLSKPMDLDGYVTIAKQIVQLCQPAEGIAGSAVC